MTEATIKVFFSYSHRDETFKDELVNHLSILQRQGVISGWHDRMIAPGHEWDREIDEQLSAADIVLLMVSSDFLASDYCWGVEVKKALERHEAGEACVIPVVLRSVHWKGTPFAKLQALPKNAKPIKSWADQDEAFTNVAEGIEVAAKTIRERRKEKAKGQLTVGTQPLNPSIESFSTQISAEEFFERALKKQNSGDYQGAIADYDQALKLNPDHALAYNNRGLARRILGDNRGAIADYDQALKLNPDDADAYNNRGIAREALGDERRAISGYDQAIKLNPDDVDAYNNRSVAPLSRMLAHFINSVNKQQDTIADFQKAAELYRQQGKTQDYEDALNRIKKLQS